MVLGESVKGELGLVIDIDSEARQRGAEALADRSDSGRRVAENIMTCLRAAWEKIS